MLTIWGTTSIQLPWCSERYWDERFTGKQIRSNDIVPLAALTEKLPIAVLTLK